MTDKTTAGSSTLIVSCAHQSRAASYSLMLRLRYRTVGMLSLTVSAPLRRACAARSAKVIDTAGQYAAPAREFGQC